MLPALYYFIRYRHLHERQRPPTRGNRIALTLALSSLSTTIASAILAPPDPFTQVLYRLAAFAVALPVAYLLVYRQQPERTSGSA
ncbi:DUF7534 family protein [Haladaptatus salinisoli]|uniref:DUF7534 family protein n=1 Tax=Haladaptatus salinisoli TaxID=2884876 RepID=UPI001D0B3F87|nr:hypothetical protein [Haladaptatus salinisoli]